MRNFIGLILFAFTVFFLSSCSKENPTDPAKETGGRKGSVAFKIDKINAPSNVTEVTAYLSRTDCDTLVKNLALYSDPASSADIAFDNIKVGVWHLKILAKATSGEILYSGETDINIEDSKTTEVYLTLTPKATGVGSVYISVKWGTTSWSDYPSNPIFKIYEGLSNPLLITQGKVMFDEGKYKMWYMNTYYSAKATVGYAESVDGIHWHNASDHAVLSPGNSGAWDDYSIGMGAVIKDNGMYKMYYCGYRDQYGQWNVGLAVSQDGISWEKYPTPVLTASDYEEKVGAGSVFMKDNQYYMIYNYAKSNGERGICLATSPDGVKWTKYSGNPVLKADQPWEGMAIYAPSVICEDGQFKMVYMNLNADAFGAAVSSDCIHWVKKGQEPFFRASQLKWCSRIAYPFLEKFNDEYRLYYSGGNTSKLELALATSSIF